MDEDPFRVNLTACGESANQLKYWVEYGLIPATFVIILFSFLQPRVRLWPNCFHMRPSIPSPVNLIDSYDDRWSFACAFAAMSTCVIMLFTGEWFYNPDISAIPSMFQGTIRIFIASVNILEICIAYYPLLLCLSTDHVIIGNTLGLVYVCGWSVYYISVLASCPNEDIEGQLSTAVFAPVFLIYLALLCRFIHGLYFAVYQWYSARKTPGVVTATDGDKEDPFTQTHFHQRVKYLLSPPKPEVNVSFTVRLRRKLIADAPGFKFSRRIICTFVLGALSTYQLGVVYILSMQTILQAFASISGIPVFNLAEVTFGPTCYFSIIVSVAYGLHMLICYRQHTIQLWRGNKDIFPGHKASFSSLMVAGLRYSGYHIGFSIWGFFLLQLLSWLIVFAIGFLIVLPLSLGTTNFAIEFLRDFWLSFVVGFVLYYLQILLSQLIFLQSDSEDKKKRHFSLNNRRLFDVTVYITLFANVVLGLVSCLMRIIKALILGVLFIGRIDRPVLMRGWELWDPGFKAYIGFLQLEVAHTHPVVITFCHLLWKAIEKNRATTPSKDEPFALVVEGQTTGTAPSRIKSRCARNRWFVALTLMRNRSLTTSRVPVLPELQQARVESRNTTNTDDVRNDYAEENVKPVETNDGAFVNVVIM